MDDQSLIEQDLDDANRFWMDDHSWLNDYCIVPKRKDRVQGGFIGCINKNPILVSILTFIFGGIAFFIVGSILL